MTRQRLSLTKIQSLYETGEDRAMLENLVRAFRKIQLLSPDDPDSFFTIAGYHGEPFRGKGITDPDWWGGYCNHGNVLFPTWHRAYLFRLENALRKQPGCENVTLPFWDETLRVGSGVPIPPILTSPTFDLDGSDVNPFYSYTLQKKLVEKVDGANERYSKPVGYKTCRYPLAGLVGTEKDRVNSEAHNSSFEDPAVNTIILNENVRNWLEGTVQITPDKTHARMPDTYSVWSRYQRCLNAPNYTVFSNIQSQNQYITDRFGKHPEDPHFVVAVESPHNAMHLAVGGFYQAADPDVRNSGYNANAIPGANGDMGDNETAGFDPIFFMHHCFIDYTFWCWQRKHELTAPGSLSVIKGYAGTISAEGLPNIPPKTPLDFNTNLYPFKPEAGAGRPGAEWLTSADLVDIENQLGYTYGDGSLDPLIDANTIVGQEEPETAPIKKFMRAQNISRANYEGSFVVRTYANTPSGKRVEVGREAVLSRWNAVGCANCQNSMNVESLVPLDETLLAVLKEGGKDEDVKYSVEIQIHETKKNLNRSKQLHEHPSARPTVVDLHDVTGA